MPYVNKPRPYKHEYETYDGTEKVKKKRAERNKARRIMMEAGKVQKGDGKDVAHSNNRTNDNKMPNLKVQSPSKNRSFKRNSSAGRKT
jgi:hypothetical protein